MKILRNTAFALSLFWSMFAGYSAHAGGYISIAGAGVLPKSSNITASGVTLGVTGKLGYGGGLLVGTQLSPYWGLEAGGVFLRRNYTGSVTVLGTAISTDISSDSVFIPAGVRIFLGRFFSIQAGGFFDVGLSSGGGSNYGVQGGVRLSIPLSASMSLFADARYNQGLKDQSGTNQSDLLLALVGLTFGGGHK